MVVSDGEILEENGSAVINSLRGKRGGHRVEIPAEEAVAAGPYAAESIPAAGDGGEGDIWFNQNGLTVSEAENPLRRLLGDDAADSAGTVADGERGGRAESIGRREERENDDGEGHGGGNGGGGGQFRHVKEERARGRAVCWVAVSSASLGVTAMRRGERNKTQP